MRQSHALAMAAAIGGMLSSCHADQSRDRSRLMTITEVIDRIDALNGQEVSVAGYLAECMGYECRLFLSARDSAKWHEYIDQLMRERKLPVGEEPPELGIGGNQDFDRKAAPFTNSYVVITGTVTNRCRYHGKPGCTDRSTDLEPLGIQAWRPPVSGRKETRQ